MMVPLLKPLTWKPQTIIRIPESKKGSEQKRVVCLGDGAAWDSRVCGGKASSLAALAAMAPLSREKFNVPGAVVLTTRAYADFRAHNKLDECLAELATYPKLNGDQRKALASRLCEAVERAQMPVNLVADLEAQLRRSIGDNFVDRSYAVRSSAVGEDSEEMSCAGQMETFLNVRGLQEASRCAVKCWASQFRHPALEYKWQHGQELEAPMAVLIQEMAQADVAGVLFTCDPVSGDPSRLVINANYGLGESVVSSLAEPDTVTLGRSEDGQLTLLEKHLGKKQMQVRAAAHGTEVQQAKNTDECCLSDEEALALGRAALEVERLHPGTPDLDLEWAIVEGELYLLQTSTDPIHCSNAHAPVSRFSSDTLPILDTSPANQSRSHTAHVTTNRFSTNSLRILAVASGNCSACIEYCRRQASRLRLASVA
ncbi:putative phosphoenolpyruvate synthase [Ixodes scapularis]